MAMGARAPPAAPGAASGGVADPTGSADDPDVVDTRELDDGAPESSTSRRAEPRAGASGSPRDGEAGASEEAVDGACGLEEEFLLPFGPQVARITTTLVKVSHCTPLAECVPTPAPATLPRPAFATCDRLRVASRCRARCSLYPLFTRPPLCPSRRASGTEALPGGGREVARVGHGAWRRSADRRARPRQDAAGDRLGGSDGQGGAGRVVCEMHTCVCVRCV